MKKSKINLIIACLSLSFAVGFIGVSADVNLIIPFKEAYGQKAININEYVKAMKLNTKDYDGKNAFYININGKGLVIYPTHKNVYIDGVGIPLKTEVVKDYFTGENFNYPIPQELVKDGDGFLIPTSVLNLLGIKSTDKGVEIPDNPTPPPNNEGETPSGGDNTGGGNNPSTPTTPTTPEQNPSVPTTTPTVPTPQPAVPTPEPVVPTQPVNPTPDPVVPTQPVTPPPVTPVPSAPTGISLTDLKGRLGGLGFVKESAHAWRYDSSNGQVGRIGIIDSDFNIGIFQDNASFDNSMSQIFNLLLPTQGSRLMSILNAPFNNQTLQMDGKTVYLKVFPQGISVTITGNAQ